MRPRCGVASAGGRMSVGCVGRSQAPGFAAARACHVRGAAPRSAGMPMSSRAAVTMADRRGRAGPGRVGWTRGLAV